MSSHCITRENTLFPNLLQTQTFCNNTHALLQSSPTFPNQHRFLLTAECSRAPWAGVCLIHAQSRSIEEVQNCPVHQSINVPHQSIQGPCVPGPRVVFQTGTKQTDGASRIIHTLGYKEMQQSNIMQNWGIGLGQKERGEQVPHGSPCLYAIKNICILTWNNHSGRIYIFLPLQFCSNVPVPLTYVGILLWNQ